MGAEGVMCPKILNPAGAQKLVHGLHYPPHGGRGVAKMVRATGFGQNFNRYYQDATENVLGIAQIETIEVLEHLDEIAAMEGVDILFIGPADLSMELGIFGQFDHPTFLDAVKKTVNAATKAGKATGILFFNTNEYKAYHDLGIRFIACGSDATFVAEGARNLAKTLDSLRNPSNPL
jgi:4-hydroxy-2-oxoheptanedioate aldolase